MRATGRATAQPLPLPERLQHVAALSDEGKRRLLQAGPLPTEFYDNGEPLPAFRTRESRWGHGEVDASGRQCWASPQAKQFFTRRCDACGIEKFRAGFDVGFRADPSSYHFERDADLLAICLQCRNNLTCAECQLVKRPRNYSHTQLKRHESRRCKQCTAKVRDAHQMLGTQKMKRRKIVGKWLHLRARLVFCSLIPLLKRWLNPLSRLR